MKQIIKQLECVLVFQKTVYIKYTQRWASEEDHHIKKAKSVHLSNYAFLCDVWAAIIYSILFPDPGGGANEGYGHMAVRLECVYMCEIKCAYMSAYMRNVYIVWEYV